MKIKFFPIILIVFFILIFAIFYKGLQTSNIYKPKTDYKKNIPIFIAKDFNTNETIKSEDIFKGDKFYLVNIWSSWCVPCREEHSLLLSLNNQENIEIVGLNYKDKKKNAKKFLEQLGNPYNFIFTDTDGLVSIEWGGYGVPESFLIHKNKIIKKIIGPIDENLLLEVNNLIQ